MKKVTSKIILAIVALLVIGTFVFLYKNSKKKPVEYEDLTASITDIRRVAVVNGQITPRNEVNIKPQINGIIAELYKEAGQEVQENEVIAKLKVIPEMSSLSSAQSRVRLAELNLEQEQTNFNREKQLYDQQLVSAEEYDKARQALDQAKEERSAAQDALEVIRDGVSKSNAKSSSTLVRSTITGLILDVPVKVGNSVIQANTMNDGTTVATIANMKDLIFDGNIDEVEVGNLHEGMEITIRIGALQNYSFDAVLEYISPKAVEKNGAKQFEIKAAVKVPDDGTMIRSGYSANAEVALDEALQVVALPESAIEFDGDKTYVYVKNGESYDKKEVEVGLGDGVNIEIKSGVSEGDVVRGNQKIEG